MAFELQVVTPTQILTETQAVEIIIPALWGQMDILPQHTDYMTTLSAGDLVIKQTSGGQTHKITGGLISVSGSKVTVLVDGIAADSPESDSQ